MIRRSIRLKIVLSFLIASLIPFIASILLVFKKGEEHLIENIKKQQEHQVEILKKTIIKDFKNLKNELSFWAGNQILNDIVVDDIDKRIQKFLFRIKEKRDIYGILVCADLNGKVIASTEKKLIGKTLDKISLDKGFKDLYFDSNLNKNVLRLSRPVYSSFHKKKIGYLIIFLFPEYLKQYTFETESNTTSLYNRKIDFFVGKELPVPQKLSINGFFEIDRYLIIYKNLAGSKLSNWYIFSEINKEILFSPLNSMENIFLAVAVFGVFIIFILSMVISTKLVEPIKLLTETADYISKTKDYSKRVVISTKDELGILAEAFNEMLTEIQKALEKIKQENKERLRLFAKLIEIINKITSAKSEKEVIDIVTHELRAFLHTDKIGFSSEKIKDAFNVSINTETVKGYLYFYLGRKITPEEKQFLESIGRMVNLYIEKIELLHKAQAASKAKSAFISNMSHELRTPLNSIIGFAQYLQMTETDENNKEAARSIEIAGRHLLEMINEILDFAKIEAGAVKVEKKRFSLKKLISEIKVIVHPLVQEKNLELILPEDTDLEINTDYRLLKQILLNLLSNAIKFTEKGYIKLDISKEEKKIYFSVIDSGIGISKENLKKLFQDFTQLENPLQKKYKGTGLGLAISKKYVELLGGKIYAYSEGEGKGSKFEFYIVETP
ncbi:ATP-binding protein [Persephonella sp.]